MSNQKSEKSISTVSSYGAMRPRQRTVQNFMLIWVDANIDESKEDYQNALIQLRSIVHDVHIFVQQDEAMNFLTNIIDIKVFLILEDSIGQLIVPLIHDIPQLDTICIFNTKKSQHEQWTKEWVKIRGVYIDIKSICEALRMTVKQYNQNSIAMSFVSMDNMASDKDLNQLEPSFMYTQILKEILLGMNYNEKSIKDFIQFMRKNDVNVDATLDLIAEFEHDYCPENSIELYTRVLFVYETLNQALRMLEGSIIINMGFFLSDLHHQIEELHQKQLSTYHGKPFTVYRGQGLSKTDFQKLMKTKGGLMSFNNFLSTSIDENVSRMFAESSSAATDTVGILFKMTINPSASTAPFASIREVSYHSVEKEILFSMHTVFRINEITEIDNNTSLYQVDLELTGDNDEQLCILTERIRTEIVGATEWERLGSLLLRIRQFEKAEQLYAELLQQTSDEVEKAIYYSQLGYIKDHQGDYKEAIEYYKKVFEILESTVPRNHPSFATFYNNIGATFTNMGEYSNALQSFEKAFDIQQIILSPNHPSLADCYNNIGMTHMNMGEFSKALCFYEKALEIYQKIRLPNHPDLTNIYNNIGLVHSNMGEFSKALKFYEKSCEIFEKSLPSNHPTLTNLYNNIGLVYLNLRECTQALTFHEKALGIQQKTLPPNNPHIAQTYNNIGAVYSATGEYSKALSFYEKALDIQQKILPPTHPQIAQSYNNIGAEYYNMGEYSKALLFYEKALDIQQKTLPPNHHLLATSYNNIGVMYNRMKDFTKALLFSRKTLEIREETLPPNHPDLATSYNNISFLYNSMKEHSKALLFYEKSREIYEKTLPSNHLALATLYSNIGIVYTDMKEYSEALKFHKKALDIHQQTPSPNYPLFALSYNNIGAVYSNMGDYPTALIYYEKALDIQQNTLPPNHPDLATTYSNMGIVYDNTSYSMNKS